MKNWEKLLLDPAVHATLKTLETPKTKQEIAEEAGIKDFRVGDAVKALKEAGIVQRRVENGKIKYVRQSGEKLDEIKQELLQKTISGNREAVENENFREAWKNIAKPPLEGEQRQKAGRLEVAQKLSRL